MVSKYGLTLGEVYHSKSYGDFKVVGLEHSERVLIKFVLTGYENFVQATHVRRGSVKDLLAPLVGGKGFVGIGKYKPKIKGKTTGSYGVWEKMIKRCYYKKDKSYKSYGGKGVTVCEDWFDFQNFARWHEEFHIEDYQLDKDIRSVGGKVYSPKTCMFVPQRINNLFIEAKHNKYNLPSGITLIDRRNKAYLVRVTRGGKRLAKAFKTLEEAKVFYIKNKTLHIRGVVEDMYGCGNLTEGLYRELRFYTFKY